MTTETCQHTHAEWLDDTLVCSDCGDDMEQPEGQPCLVCKDTGIDDYQESWCKCAAGKAEWAKIEREFAWMKPHVAEATRAERDGDYETARAITESCGVRYTGPDR